MGQSDFAENTPNSESYQSVSNSKLVALVALAKEPSSEKRRELLHEVTDLFLSGSPTSKFTNWKNKELDLFDDVLKNLNKDMEEELRLELSNKVSFTEYRLPGLMKDLSQDDIRVAEPVLRHSKALSDKDLIELASIKGQEHLRVIAQRDRLSDKVSDVVVARGDDTTLEVLLNNETAVLSRKSSEIIVDRALVNPALHKATIERKTLPIDLLNEMYFVVEARLRKKILDRNENMDPKDLEKALAKSRRRLEMRDGSLPEDMAEAEIYITKLLETGKVTPDLLISLLREKQKTKFILALAQMTDVDFHTAKNIIEQRQIDALAVICKAADFDKALFLTFALTILNDEKDGIGKAEEYSFLYRNLPVATAQRTLRFWRIRRESEAASVM